MELYSWSLGTLLVATPLRKNDSHLPEVHQLPIAPQE